MFQFYSLASQPWPTPLHTTPHHFTPLHTTSHPRLQILYKESIEAIESASVAGETGIGGVADTEQEGLNGY